ncbi:unnamed protein product, partial [Polarella glacialis]
MDSALRAALAKRIRSPDKDADIKKVKMPVKHELPEHADCSGEVPEDADIKEGDDANKTINDDAWDDWWTSHEWDDTWKTSGWTHSDW